MGEEKLKPAYYSILPASVRYDKTLHPNAKILYSEITALCQKEGYCWATNSYFSELYDVSERSVINWINNLREKSYIKTQLIFKDNTKEVVKRLIYILDPTIIKNLQNQVSERGENNFTTPGENSNFIPSEKKFTTPTENNFTRAHEKKFRKTGEKKFIDNNTSLNTIKFLSLPSREKKEFLEKVWLEKNLKSDYVKYFLFREDQNWEGVVNLEANILKWENGFKDRNPDLYIEKKVIESTYVEESQEVKDIRSAIKFKIDNWFRNEDGVRQRLLGKIDLRRNGEYWELLVEEENILEAMKYQEVIEEISVKICTK